MPDMFWMFVAMLVSGFYLWLFFQTHNQRPGFDWLNKPSYGFFVGLFGLAVVFVAIAWANMGLLRVFILMALWIPCGLTALMPFGHKAADIISNAGSLGLRNIPTYDQAQAAEQRHDFQTAEILYLETFEEARRRKYPEEDWAEGRLAYGNLLQRLGRLPEAAAFWEKAATGNLMADRALTSALRAADVWRDLNAIDHARDVLQRAIDRFPRDPVTPTLRRRLQGLPLSADSLKSGGK